MPPGSMTLRSSTRRDPDEGHSPVQTRSGNAWDASDPVTVRKGVGADLVTGAGLAVEEQAATSRPTTIVVAIGKREERILWPPDGYDRETFRPPVCFERCLSLCGHPDGTLRASLRVARVVTGGTRRAVSKTRLGARLP